MVTRPSSRVAIPAACLALAAVARGYGLEIQSLWLDEFLAFQIGQQDLSGMWRTAAAIHGQSPFYYLAVRGWSEVFGRDSVLVVRSLSVVLGLASLVQAWLFARRWFGPARADLTLVLLAVSPAHLYFSQEARMYPLLAVLLLGALQLAVAAVRDPAARGIGRLVAHGVLVGLALYTHYYAVLFVGTLDVWLLLRRREAPGVVWRIAAVQAAVAIAYLPWVPALLGAASSGGNTFIEFTELKGLYTALVFSLGYSSVPIDSVAKRDLIGTFVSHAPKLAVGGLAFGWLFLAGVRDLWQRDRSLASLVVGWILLPILFATLVSLFFIPAISERYFFPALPFFALVLACGIVATRGLVRWLPVGVVAVLTLQSLVTYYTDPVYGHHDWRQAVERVERRADDGDALLFHPSHIADCYRFYAGDERPWFVANGPDEAGALPADRRYWLVISHPRPQRDRILARLEERFRRVDYQRIPRGEGIDIYLFEPRGDVESS